jgi:hypothetical protein
MQTTEHMKIFSLVPSLSGSLTPYFQVSSGAFCAAKNPVFVKSDEILSSILWFGFSVTEVIHVMLSLSAPLEKG